MATLRWDVEGAKEMMTLNSRLSALRSQASNALHSANDIRVGVLETICRNRIKELENSYRNLQTEFIACDNVLAGFLEKWLGPSVKFPTLNAQLAITLHYQSLSASRDAVRGLLTELGHIVEDRLGRANSLLALMVSLATLAVATIALLK